MDEAYCDPSRGDSAPPTAESCDFAAIGDLQSSLAPSGSANVTSTTQDGAIAVEVEQELVDISGLAVFDPFGAISIPTSSK